MNTTPGQFGPTPQGAPGLNPVSATPTPPPSQWSQVQPQLTQDFKQADSTSLSWEIKGLKSIFEQTRGEVRFLARLILAEINKLIGRSFFALCVRQRAG